MPPIAIRVLAALLTMSLLAACGGSSHSQSSTTSHRTTPPSNGVAARPPDVILRTAVTTLDRARTVHVQGSFQEGGRPTALNLDMVRGRGVEGSVEQGGLSFQLVSINRTVYIKAGSRFWQHYAGSLVAPLLEGRWFRAPLAGQLAALAPLTSVARLVASLTALPGTLVKGPQTTVDGRRVIAVQDPTQSGTLYVATTGPPYPIEITGRGARRGTLVFDRFNQPMTVTAPPNAVGLPFQ